MPQEKTNSNTSGNLSRPPIVAVLGHVDHGKTSLLDTIRKTQVASREFGGITQSIGAYQVVTPEGVLTFIDTPGHEAFLAMRSRGAQAADIAILVVAANDSVMPQTIESIKIIKEANIPFIVAINKVDLPEANTDKVVQDLLRYEVLMENYGGDVPWVKVSAKTGEGIKELLELIYLLMEMNGINSDTKAPLDAPIVESKMDKGRGAVATVVVRNGILSVGQKVYAGEIEAKVRSLIDYTGKQIQEATPGTPVEILGFTKVPPVGTRLTENINKEAVSSIQSYLRKGKEASKNTTLNVIIKADSLGSLEAIIAKFPENINLLDSGVGDISEADVLLAKNTKSIILGFNVKATSPAVKIAETEKVLVRTYKIIYQLLDELEDAAAGILEVETETILGKGTIIAQFPYEKLKVAGTKITEGRLARGDLVRIVRGEIVVGETKVKSIRLMKEEVNKVDAGGECGVLTEPQVDFQISDDIISYR